MSYEIASEVSTIGADSVSRGRMGIRGPAVFERLIDASSSDLKSPHRSTVPLLAAWRDPRAALLQLGELLDEPFASTASFCFEHTEPVTGGRGKASCTDLMITTKTQAVAIEAKYKEPAYATVQKWLEAGRSIASEEGTSQPAAAASTNREDV